MHTEPAELFLITGAMAAGKSTVAQLLAEQFTRSVHLRGDAFRKMIVAGREDMRADPSPEALAQLRLRYELMANAADRYVAAGFTSSPRTSSSGRCSRMSSRCSPRPPCT